MIVTVYQNQWMTLLEHDAIRTDPTRMAQGIMTGIGFLGAGVIFKEGLTVRGLTTAASIWVTAAIGILVGIGFWFAAIVGAAAVLVVLALFRFIETRLPSEFYAHHMLRFLRERVMAEDDLRKLIGDHGFTIANLSCRLIEVASSLKQSRARTAETRRDYRCICAACRRLLSSGSPLREISCHNQPETKRDRYAIHAPGLDMWDEPAKISSSIWRREGGGSP